MAASHYEKDGFSFHHMIVNDVEEKFLGEMFDNLVDYDIHEWFEEQRETKLLKRTCIIKVLMFPVQYVLTRVLLGKLLAKDCSISNKLYWNYLRKKITKDQFKKELTNTLKKSKLSIK